MHRNRPERRRPRYEVAHIFVNVASSKACVVDLLAGLNDRQPDIALVCGFKHLRYTRSTSAEIFVILTSFGPLRREFFLFDRSITVVPSGELFQVLWNDAVKRTVTTRLENICLNASLIRIGQASASAIRCLMTTISRRKRGICASFAWTPYQHM